MQAYRFCETRIHCSGYFHRLARQRDTSLMRL